MMLCFCAVPGGGGAGRAHPGDILARGSGEVCGCTAGGQGEFAEHGPQGEDSGAGACTRCLVLLHSSATRNKVQAPSNGHVLCCCTAMSVCVAMLCASL